MSCAVKDVFKLLCLYQFFAWKRKPSDRNHWWLLLYVGQLWRREFKERSMLLKLASYRLITSKCWSWKCIIIMQTSTSGTRSCGPPAGSSNRMLSSNSLVMTVEHGKEWYSWERILDIKTERKDLKLSRMNNLVAAMLLGWREENSVALHYCKNQIFQIPVWNFRDQILLFWPKGIAQAKSSHCFKWGM